MFDNFISLGSSCLTAACMQKYGLRSWAGPFDWVSSPVFESVLHFLETDFSDFLERESLKAVNQNGLIFRDQQYDLTFPHEEVEESIFSEKDYEQVFGKYQKRLARFRMELKKKNCFLRGVTEQEEIEYVMYHREYIHRVIHMDNPYSDIVFLVKRELEIPDGFPFLHYIMPGEYSVKNMERMRGWFDGAEDFLMWTGENFNGYQMYKNLLFDRQKMNDSYWEIVESRYQLLLRLTQTDFERFNLPERVIIYGAGNIGKYFYKHIKEKCHVHCFVDEYIEICRGGGGLAALLFAV